MSRKLKRHIWRYIPKAVPSFLASRRYGSGAVEAFNAEDERALISSVSKQLGLPKTEIDQPIFLLRLGSQCPNRRGLSGLLVTLTLNEFLAADLQFHAAITRIKLVDAG